MSVEFTLIEPSFNTRGDSNYHPCACGLHLCGIAINPRDEQEHEQPYTALNIPARDDDEARRMFEAAKAEAALPDREGEDFICDLNLSDGYVDDFGTNRQLLPRLVAAARAAQGQGVMS